MQVLKLVIGTLASRQFQSSCILTKQIAAVWCIDGYIPSVKVDIMITFLCRQAKLSFLHSSNGCTLNAFLATEAAGTAALTYVSYISVNGSILDLSWQPGMHT